MTEISDILEAQQAAWETLIAYNGLLGTANPRLADGFTFRMAGEDVHGLQWRTLETLIRVACVAGEPWELHGPVDNRIMRLGSWRPPSAN